MKKIILSFCILFLFSANIFAENYSLSFDGVDGYVTFDDLDEFDIIDELTISVDIIPSTLKTTSIIDSIIISCTIVRVL